MSNTVLTNAGLWVAEYNLAGDANMLSLGAAAELLDDTVIGDSFRSRCGGLKKFAFAAEGFWNDVADAYAFADVGLSNVPVTIAPAATTAGSTAFVGLMSQGDYTPHNASVGELSKFSISGEGVGLPIARGQVLANATVGASGTGTACLIGAASAGQTVCMALHVLSMSGTSPTLAVVVQSDDNVGFTSPVTVATFATASAGTNLFQFASVAGPRADTYYRVSYTVTGTGPSISFVAALGLA
jgi:hypothetical protein